MAEAIYNYKLIQANLDMYQKKVNLHLDQAMAELEMTDQQQKLIALKDNEEFIHQLLAADTVEDAQKLFAEQGAALTIEEIEGMLKTAAEASNKIVTATDELTDEELDQITGGGLIKQLFNTVAFAFCGALIGSIVGTLVGLCFGPMGAVAGMAIGAALGAVGGALLYWLSGEAKYDGGGQY